MPAPRGHPTVSTTEAARGMAGPVGLAAPLLQVRSQRPRYPVARASPVFPSSQSLRDGSGATALPIPVAIAARWPRRPRAQNVTAPPNRTTHAKKARPEGFSAYTTVIRLFRSTHTMSQRHQIEVPSSDPFRHDLLDRKPTAEIYTELLEQVDSPCVFALNAGWGAGKTTFIRLWAEYAGSKGFNCAVFNSWESEHYTDPLLSLVFELTSSHKTPKSKRREKFQEVAGKLCDALASSAEGAVKSVAFGADIGPFFGRVGIQQARLASYREVRKTFRDFKKELTELAREISDKSGGLPLVLFIDELDRCRPTHAIELLECAKHLFDVENLVFVLGINMRQLENSVRAVYGGDLDAGGYLRRILDHELKLPRKDPDRKKFVVATCERLGIFKTENLRLILENRVAGDILADFLATSNLEIRDIEQALSRLLLIFRSVPDNVHDYVLITTCFLTLRALHTSLYDKFTSRAISDAELYAELARTPQWEHVRVRCREELVATFISDREQSPLWRLLNDQSRQTGKNLNQEATTARRILERFDLLMKTYNHRVDFGDIIQRVDLLYDKSRTKESSPESPGVGAHRETEAGSQDTDPLGSAG